MAGAITDFEAPSALALALHSDTPDQMLKLGEVLEGITTIDIYDLPPETTVVPWIAEIKLLDLFLEIQYLRFWAVLVDQVTIDTTVYKKGFGFVGDIALFGKPIRLYVEVQQANQRFAGSVEFPDSIELGNVLTLSRPTAIAIDSKQDLAVSPGTPSSHQGPALQVSSFLDSQHKYYLFVAAHVVLLDVIKIDILGEANNDGIKFSYDVAAGTSGSGAWAQQKIDVLVSREKLAFSAGLAYDFGLKNVTLGGFDLFGVLPIPSISLPNFEIGISGTICAGLLPPKFSLGGSLEFSFMGLDLDEGFSIDVDLTQAPSKIAGFRRAAAAMDQGSSAGPLEEGAQPRLRLCGLDQEELRGVQGRRRACGTGFRECILGRGPGRSEGANEGDRLRRIRHRGRHQDSLRQTGRGVRDDARGACHVRSVRRGDAARSS